MELLTQFRSDLALYLVQEHIWPTFTYFERLAMLIESVQLPTKRYAYLKRVNKKVACFYTLLRGQRHVVIIGTSFIGMEVAAYLVDKAASVTVVGRSSTPFAHVFGKLKEYC